jgi:hypothetical protein
MWENLECIYFAHNLDYRNDYGNRICDPNKLEGNLLVSDSLLGSEEGIFSWSSLFYEAA